MRMALLPTKSPCMFVYFLQKQMKALFFVVVLLGGLSLQNIAIAQISFTGSYTQNFDSYVSLATLPSGWASGGTGSFQGTGTGSATTGGFYSFNPTASTSERSLGALRSGSATGYYEVTFTNNTGSTLTSVTVSYDFEQYRSANTSGWAVLFNGTSNAALSVAGVASGITTGTPAVTNLSTNITGLSIANGTNFTMRWTVTDASGSDNPIAVDNFSMTSCVTPTTYSVTGTGSYCSGGSGVAVGLSNSQTGVTYQLYNGAATVGSAVSGSTGSPISFGSQTTAATYTVVATRTTGGCTANMSGSAVVTINSLPIAQTVNGGGAYCAGGTGVLVGLAGSQSGVHYQLYNGASAVGSPVPGTGSAISFGSQTTAATYTVVGTNTVTACAQSMTGSASVSVNPLPSVVVTPSGGSSCVSMTASGASTYIWSPATGLSATTGATVTATPTVTTVYTITGTDGVGCVGATTVTVTPPAIAMTATSPAIGSVPQGTTNHVLQVYNLAVTASEAVLTDLTVTTAGSYTTSDLINLKCWYSTSSTFDAGTATLLSTFTTPGAAGSKVFPAFVSQTIPAATTGHIFITGDIAGVATGGNTINIASTPFSGFSICGANLSGTDPIAAANSQTITAAPCTGTPTGGAADAVPAVICGSGTSVITLSGGAAGSGLTYQWSSNITNTPPGTNISGATNSVYTTGTVASTTYYWCTTTCSTSSLSSISSVGTVSINPVPSSTGATNDGAICVGGTATLSANSLNATAWAWQGPGGFTSSLEHPTASPTVTGTYSLTVASVGDGCDPATVYTTTVSVNPAPASSGPTNDGPLCTGGSVALSANSTNATGWSWSGPGGFTSTLENPVATSAAAGIYSLTLSSAGPGCSPATVYTTSVTVFAVPSSTGATNSGPICTGNSVTLNANSTSATSWTWTGSDGFTSSLQNPVTSPTATTTYSLTVSRSGSGCSPATIYTTTVTVNTTPTVVVTPAGGTSGVSMTASGATTYTWLPASGLSASTGATVTATPTVTTTYTVSGTTTGCIGTTTVTVNFPGGSATWNFTAGTGTASASTNVNLPASGCVASIGNTLGTVASPINGTSASSGYTGSTGGNNIGNAAQIGAFNSSSSPYINLLLTPNAGYCLSISGLSFGTRSTGTAPQAFTVSSDVAGFGSSVGSGAIANNSTWSLKTPTITSFTGAPGTAINLRIYGHSGAGSPGSSTINWRLDDIAVTYSVNPSPSLSGATNGGTICAGGTVNLFANAPQNVASYSWAGPNSFTSTEQNPSINLATVAATGTYTVTVGNGSGCSAVYTTSVTVNPTPASTGATNNGPICLGGTVTFFANSTNTNQWTWTGPDGFTSSLQNPTATPTITGTYSLTVNNTVTGCSSAIVYTSTINVNAVPTSSGPANDGPICVGGTVNLSANSTGATAWSWSGPSGASSTLQNPSFTPTATGTYSLTVSTTGSGCNPATVYTTTVTVNPAPSSTGATNDGAICIGGTATLSANSTAATAWSWSGPDGFTSSVQNPTATPTATGTYSLTLSSTGSGCNPATVYTTTVTVNPVPSSTGATNGGAICVGGTATLSANSTAATAWSWSGPDGFTSSVQNPTATPTATGTYSLTLSSTGSGCNPATVYTTTVTVNPVPSSTGATNGGAICVGGTATLSANSTGATAWSWSGPDGFTSSVQKPTATPTATGTYSLTLSSTGSGCNPATVYTTTVTVNHVPSSTGATNGGAICVGGTATLSANSTAATAWSWNGPDGFTSSVQNPTATPTATGTYSLTLSSIGSGCNPATVYTTTVTVNPLPAAITGSTSVCVGSTTNLINSGGGTWMSTNTAAATIGSSTGIVAGVSSGTTVISYILPTSCFTTTIVTVNATPVVSATSGTAQICAGATTTLSNATSSGVWSSSNTTTATVSAAGIVTGLVAGTSNISYTVTNGFGCANVAAYIITVNPVPVIVSVTGPTNLCVGASGAFTSSTTGGSWSSSNVAVATIGTSGAVSALTSGTSTITYSVTNAFGCTTEVLTIITVNATPSVTAITGSLNACVGASVTLSSTPTGGTWISSNTAVATISSAGIVNGLTAGTTSITYTVTNAFSCSNATSVVMTLNAVPVPSNISGSLSVCTGATTSLAVSGISGGTWSSSNLSVASVGTSGIVTGGSAGTASVNYTTFCGTATRVVTVNPRPAIATIGNDAPVCAGDTVHLSSSASGGTGSLSYNWSGPGSFSATGSGPAISGSATASTGTFTLTVTDINACAATGTNTTLVSVNPLPAVIAGNPNICIGFSTNLSNTVSGGNWTSSNSALASVNSSGVVSGNVLGTAIISYQLPTGCYRTMQVTVNPFPEPIVGDSLIYCIGTSVALTSGTAGGNWTSSNPAIVSANAGTGVVTATGPGVATISYTAGSVCARTVEVTVNPTMNANAGTPVICLGQALSIAILTNDAPGGTWSSSNVAKAIVSPETGVVKGKVAGTVVITYMMNPTCFRTTVVTINPAVSTITGALNVCPGATTTLLNATPGGTWSSNDTTMAKVNPATGLVTGYTSGTTVITYLVSTGCYRTANVNMPAAPLSIVGPDTICQGAVATMSSTPAGGTWSSSNASRASVNAGTGNVTGVSVGSATITYRISSGCFTTKGVTVNNIAASITGTANICPGATTDLSHVITGGTWTSSNTAKATVDPTNGLVTGISGGTAVISYFTSPGCYKTTIQTVYTAPTNISGVATVCEGFQTTLASGPSGGSWSSSTTGVASVATGGLVTAIASGVTTITYQSTAGCYVTRDVTVNSLPAAITGPGVVCMGSAPLFATSSTGGVWSSSNLIKATIDASTGIITPLSSGVTNISYTLPTGCYRKVTTTVSPVPAAIAGIDSVCEGSTTALTVATGGGVWSSSNTAKATINSLGVVTGMSAGTTSISYQLASGCFATRTVSVNTLPAVTAGVASACIGDNVTFTASPVGGFWSSSNTSVATINSASGTITGVGAGSSTISYILSSGCFSTAPLAFYAAPPAIVGVNVICEGASTTFTNTASGGVWSSANTAVATVGTTGVVVGTGSGVTNITYQVGTGCYVARSVTVNSVPSPLGGSLVICAGNTTTLSVTPSGGVWSSSNTTRATVDATGIVQGLTAGTAVITYSTGAGTGCFTAAVVTVNALPGVITGTASVCAGNSTSLATTPTGGSWSSSNTGIATIDAMIGVAAGIAAGTANIVYTMPGGCFTSTTLTVNAGPMPNTGGNVICLGQPVAIAVVTNPTTGGTWTSGNTLRAVISPSTGVMVGQSTGTVNITYTIGTGCYSVTQVTVNGAVGAVSGPASICVGTAVALSDTTPSGTWMSSNLTKATIDAGTGMVTGISAGGVVITYYVNSGCYKTRSIAVNTSPAPITGASTVIVGESTTLTSSSSGIWTSSDTSVAAVNLSTGVVTGVNLGSATISYRFSSGCYVAHPLAVIAGKQGNVVTDTDSEVMLTVSPNPTSGALSINAPVAGMLTIATLDGRIVERYTIRKAQNSITLPSHLSAGIYMCRFTGENGISASVKVVYEP